jgi:NAD(P)-dependent dehydrogenase (short-subunit alcohol dehydrogenase family)
MILFRDKNVVITGGATGIGKTTAEKFLDAEAFVYVLDINKPEITRENFKYLNCDVSDLSSIKKCAEIITQERKNIHVLFTNAGIHAVSKLEDVTPELFYQVVDVNIKGTFFTIQIFLPIMKKQGFGNIVLMGSDQCFIGKGSSSIYGLTKGAIGQLTKSTAIDYAEYGIRVNCICPGTIDTPLYHNAVKNFSQKCNIPSDNIYDEFKTAQPIQRIGKTEEIAEAVLFLSCDKVNFMTGSLLSVDGGYVAQ